MIDRYEVKSIKEIFSDKYRFKIYSQIEYLRIEFCSLIHENLHLEFNKTHLQITDDDLNIIKHLENTTKHEIGAFLNWFAKYKIDNKYLHHSLTSSDLLDAALNIQIQNSKEIVKEKFDDLYISLYSLLNKYGSLPYMARTHGQLAKEITLGHFLNNRIEHLERSFNLFLQASNELNFIKIRGPVGDSTNLDLIKFEELVNSFFGMNKQEIEVTQIVPRDLYSNLIYSMISIGTAIEKLALDIRLMSQSGIEEISENFSVNQIGSSAMPHKKNPIICENITGLNRMLKSYLYPAIENILLWNYRDMTHSSVERIIIPDSFHLLCNMISKMASVVDSLNINEDKLIKNITEVNLSTVILERLTKDLGYQEAYKETQLIMQLSQIENKHPNQLLYERFKIQIES